MGAFDCRAKGYLLPVIVNIYSSCMALLAAIALMPDFSKPEARRCGNLLIKDKKWILALRWSDEAKKIQRCVLSFGSVLGVGKISCD